MGCRSLFGFASNLFIFDLNSKEYIHVNMSPLFGEITDMAVQALLETIRSKSQNPVRKIAECRQLSETLANECKINLSEYTIARLFRVIPSRSMPSRHTLDSLSEYCGYSSWEAFVANQRDGISEGREQFRNPTKQPGFRITETEVLLFQSCLENKAYQPVLEYLRIVVPCLGENYSSENVFPLVDLLGIATRTMEDARNALIPVFVREESLRNFYFNNWVDMDGITTYYGEIVEKYYLKNIHPTSKRYRNDDIWAWSIIMYRHLYECKAREFLRTGYALFSRYHSEEITIDSVTHHFPVARFHACHIMYTYFSAPATPASWYEKKMQYILAEVERLPPIHRAVFIPQIAEALYVARQPELVLAFTPVFNEFVEKHYVDHRFAFERSNLQKLMFYLHLAIEETKGALSFQDQFAGLFSKGVDEDFMRQHLPLSEYMNLIVKSLYRQQSEERKELLKEARQLGLRLKNRFFERMAARRLDL